MLDNFDIVTADAPANFQPVRDQHLGGKAQRLMRHWSVQDVIIPFAASRLALVLVGYLAMNLLAHVPGAQPHWELGARGNIVPNITAVSPSHRPLVNMWSRWDAGWYRSIAAHGYSFAAGGPSNTAFFPVYPMLMRAIHGLVPSNTDASWFMAGIIVSNVAACVALAFLFLLVRQEFGQSTAQRAVIYLIVFPMTLFLSAVYSESVFLAFVIAAFYYARKRLWWVAGCLAAAATLSRPPGIVVPVALTFEYLRQHRFAWRELRADLLALLFGPAALVCYFGYLHIAQGNAGAVIHAQQGWGLQLEAPWVTFVRYLRGPLTFQATAPYNVIDFVALVIFAALVCIGARRLPLCYTVYGIIYLGFITAWGSFQSAPRYVLGIFPAFILLALAGRHAVFDRCYTCVSMALASFFMVVFALWGWVA